MRTEKKPKAATPEGGSEPVTPGQLRALVAQILEATPVIDIHTHLFPATFGHLALSGIDALLTYHYLEAELFRFSPISPDEYWRLQPAGRAELVWQTLFVDNTPVSEATRGVVAVLSALGLDPSISQLDHLRAFFREQEPARHVDRVLDLAGVDHVVMTNDPLDELECACWDRGATPGPRFKAALRIDRLLNQWDAHHAVLASRGYAVDAAAGASSFAEIRRFLSDWIERILPLYLAVSLPDTFDYPADDIRTRLLTECVLPACREAGIPLALMIGVRRQVNPSLKLAGDGSGRTDLRAVATLCERFPENRFLVTVLSRENQHELCVLARKFSNLLPFGCWWFLNNPSIVDEITRQRLEMLGTSFIPQHSDARVLEQLIYKWRNTRRTLAPVLTDAYRLLAEDGGRVTRQSIERDVLRLFRDNFAQWTPPNAPTIGARRD